MRSIAIFIIFVSVCLSASGLQAEIYFWTDENGVKHYSQTPPVDRAVHIKAVPEIQSSTASDQKTEKINEENIKAILEAFDKTGRPFSPKPVKTKKPLSRQERIQAEKERLEDKILYIEGLPSRAFANSRSRQAIIGRYQYRMQQLLSNPDKYFETDGN